MHCVAWEEPQVHSIYLHCTVLCFHIINMRVGDHVTSTLAMPLPKLTSRVEPSSPSCDSEASGERRPEHTEEALRRSLHPPPFRTLAKHPSALFLQIRLFWAFHPIKYLSPMFLALLLHMLFSKFLNVEHVVGSISFSGLGPYSPYAYVAIYPFTLLLMRHWPFPFWHFCQVLYEYIHACTCFKTCF